MEVLGIVPARAGSKGVPDKNLRLLGGEPLIGHTLRAAKSASRLTRVMVSTDSNRIADVARSYGAEIPFLRPSEIAGDSSPMVDVIRHALATLRDRDGYAPAIVVLLQPTVPFRTAAEIDRTIESLERSPADAVVTVSPVPLKYNPAWQLRLKDGDIEPYDGRPIGSLIGRRQDLEPTYVRDGAIYAFKTDAFWQTGSIYGRQTAGIVSGSASHVNIDSLEDWEAAERFLRTGVSDV